MILFTSPQCRVKLYWSSGGLQEGGEYRRKYGERVQ